MSDSNLNSLITWLNTFELHVPHSTVEDISTGVALADVLTQIAPEWFSQLLYPKIKRDVVANWRLKVSNLKKIIETVIEYYVECLNQPLIGYKKPDAQKIGEHCDAEETKKLLQLILGCAVNCQQKQRFIIRIMDLDEAVQRDIMQNIQDLLGGNLNFESLDENDKTQQKLLMDELQDAKEQKDQLYYKCTELDQQLCNLQEENSTLQSHNNELQLRLSELQSLEGDALKTNYKLLELQKQIENLKDEIYKLETSRDDCMSKISLLQKERTDLQRKQVEFQKITEEARILKDEVDALREQADKVMKYEVTLESYKKKMEDYTNLKKQMKVLEDKNVEYLRNKLDYEDEIKRNQQLKSHLDICKKQLIEAFDKLDEQINKNESLEFEMKKLEAELDSIKREKDRVITECSTLKETNEELRCNQLITTENIMYVNNDEAVSNTDFIPPSVKEKLVLLEYENKMLKLNQLKETEDKLPIQALLGDSEERVNELRVQNRKANQKITELESKLEELQRNQSSESKKDQQKIQSLQDNLLKLQTECERLSTHNDDTENDAQLQKRKLVALQELLSKKEHELSSLEERYKRYVDKAKAVIKILDPRQQVSSLSLHSLSQLRKKVNMEKKQLIEIARRARIEAKEDKENIIVENEEDMKIIKEQEESMMTTAFHNFGFKNYRDIVDKKIAVTSASFKPTFMNMQREPTSRRTSTISRFK